MMKLSYQDRTFARKMAYTVMVVLVSVVLSHVPVYGVNSDYMSAVFGKVSILGFSDMLTGGGLSQLAVGGFAVTSIIVAGILIQLVSILIPKVEQIRSDGEVGRRMFERIQFALALVLTLSIGIVIASTMSRSSLYTVPSPWLASVSVTEWLIGTAVIAGLAQGVTRHGIGNGPTLILAANIALSVPETVLTWSRASVSWKHVVLMAVAFVVVLILAVLLQGGTIRIPVQNPRKERSVMNVIGEVPVPVAASSVLPVVYATAIMTFPTVLALFVKDNKTLDVIISACTQTNWYAPTHWYHWAGLALYVLLVIGFSSYASRISFSSAEVANHMRERGDVIVGVRPGDDTVAYLERRRRRISRVSAVMLLAIAVVPDFVLARVGMHSLPFMGVSLIILMAAFYDMRLRVTGMTKHWNRKYRLFDDRKASKEVERYGVDVAA